MKTTVTLTDENVAGLVWAVKLTGLSLQEIVNLLLAKIQKATNHPFSAP
jgi:hypothetical protein